MTSKQFELTKSFVAQHITAHTGEDREGCLICVAWDWAIAKFTNELQSVEVERELRAASQNQLRGTHE